VHADFEHIGKAFTVATLCVYGGSPYGPQEGALRRGVDVLVGTPGRVKDLMEKGTLKLDKLMCGGLPASCCGRV
jgi:ATP-dependent RNA helicase DDX21